MSAQRKGNRRGGEKRRGIVRGAEEIQKQKDTRAVNDAAGRNLSTRPKQRKEE